MHEADTATTTTLPKEPTAAIEPDEIERVFAAQQANRDAVAATDATARIEKLKALLETIEKNRQAIRDALHADFRKPPAEVDLTETYVVTSEIKHAIKHLPKWMKPRRVRPVRALLTTRAWIRYEPKGNVLIISPWNFPFNLTLGPLVSAIAAGNCAVVKPSEFTPHTSELCKNLVEKLFPKDEIAFFLGDQEVAKRLLTKPFNHVFFTGSPEVGKLVMKAAAEHLASVTLELGGKSPVIVDETADVTDAAQKVAWGKFMNNGQTCLAPDYVYVHERVYAPFLEALKQAVERSYGTSQEERRRSPDYARIITERHHVRLRHLLEESVKQGAKVEFGGTVDERERYLEPTVVTHVPEDAPLMQKEIFGPILPVHAFASLNEVLQVIRSKPRPLALYVFSRNRAHIERVFAHTASGGSCINDVVLHFMHLNLPFGGINHSGIGNAHGFYGFKAFSHERAYLKQSRFSPLKWMYPPYRPRVQKLIDLTLKYF